MGDFSFVRDQQGKVCGIWVARAEDTGDQMYLMTLFMRGGVSSGEMSSGFRVVPNKADGRGGAFAMLGSTPAPGEG